MDPEVAVLEIRLVETFVGSQHVITSPDMPGLYVANDDLETARRSVEPAVRMLGAMKLRRAERERLKRRTAAST